MGISVTGKSQNVQFTATGPSAAGTGETFELTYSLNARPDDFRAPNFSPFVVVGGPSTSSSTSIEMSGSKVQQTITSSYTYYLQASSLGKYVIPGAQATVKGKTYTSNTVTIEVVKGAANQKQTPSQNNSGEEESTRQVEEGKNLYAAYLVSKRDVYVGEPVIVTLKIFDRMGLTNLDMPKMPPFTGFYKTDIPTPPLRQLSRENVGGQIYNTGVVSRFILYPQKSGTLTIGAADFSGIVQQTVTKRHRSWFDDFGFDFPTVQQQQVAFKSPAVSIHVKELPGSQPANFSGAVGDVKMNVSIDKKELNANDALTVKVQISGNANLKLITPPTISFPSDFDSYPPKISVQDENTTGGTSGTVTMEYIAIPRLQGHYTVPAVSFSYFSLSGKAYKTLTSSPIDIVVNKGRQDSSVMAVSGISHEDVQYIGKDIRFIKTSPVQWKKANSLLLMEPWAFLLYLVPLLMFVLAIIIRRKTIKEKADLARLRNKKANTLAKKRLKAAARALQGAHHEVFYDELLKAIWGYLSDKLTIPVSDLSRDKAWELLRGRGIPDEMLQRLSDLLDACEYARYAPSGAASPMQNLYTDAAELIASLEQKLR